MTAKYFAILTNYGAAQLANAVALGTQMNISKWRWVTAAARCRYLIPRRQN